MYYYFESTIKMDKAQAMKSRKIVKNAIETTSIQEDFEGVFDEMQNAVHVSKGDLVIDTVERIKRVFSMYGGTQRLVTIRFINPLLDAVVDRFGTTDFQYAKVDDTHFSVTGYVEISNQFFGWLLGFGNKAKILYPEDTIKELADYLEKVRGMYNV